MALLNPSVTFRRQVGWGRTLPPSSLPSWILRAWTSPNVARFPSCAFVHMLLPLSRAIFSLVYFDSSKLNIAVTSKESTMISPLLLSHAVLPAHETHRVRFLLSVLWTVYARWVLSSCQTRTMSFGSSISCVWYRTGHQ